MYKLETNKRRKKNIAQQEERSPSLVFCRRLPHTRKETLFERVEGTLLPIALSRQCLVLSLWLHDSTIVTVTGFVATTAAEGVGGGARARDARGRVGRLLRASGGRFVTAQHIGRAGAAGHDGRSIFALQRDESGQQVGTLLLVHARVNQLHQRIERGRREFVVQSKENRIQ